MKIKIYEGNKIGGCITEVSADKTKIIFDYGLNLDDTPQINIKGLTFDKPEYSAVFISHYHGDHIGNIAKVLPKIPIYIEETTCKLFKIMNDFGKGKVDFEKLNITTFRFKEEIVIGNLKVIPYIVDHSAYNSCMFLVTDGREKALYTGDYRDNGKKGKLLLPTIKEIGKVDYLITEGTTVNSDTHSIKKESELEKEFIEVFKKYKQVFIMMSTANIDRIPVVFKAAMKTNHVFIQDLYMAHITNAIGEKIPNPDFTGVYVYKPVRYIRSKNGEFKAKYVDNSFNNKNDASRLFVPFVMNIRQGMKNDLKILKKKNALNNACMIYSMWGGYKGKKEMIEFKNGVKEMGIEWLEKDIHATGHATKETIEKVIKLSGVKKENVYLIHTNAVNSIKKTYTNIKGSEYNEKIR